MPAEDDLRVGFAIFFSQLCKYALFNQVPVPMPEGIPCLNHDLIFIQKFFQFLFLGIRMYFCLKDCGRHLACVQNFLNLFSVKIGKSDCLYLAFLVCLFHEPVARNIIAGRLMDEKKINIVRIQPFQRLFDSILIFIEGRPDFCLKENIFPLQPGFLHRAANCFFREVLSSVFVNFFGKFSKRCCFD